MFRLNCIILVASFLIAGCKKTDIIAFSLTGQLENDRAKLSWKKITSKQFLRYEVYRSDSAFDIVDERIPARVTKVFSTADAERIDFTDSVDMNTGANYYRVMAVLNERNIVSNQVDLNNGYYGIEGFGSFSMVAPQSKKILFFDGASTFQFDCVKEKFVRISRSLYLNDINLIGSYNNEEVIYSIKVNDNKVLVRNPNTLDIVHEFNTSLTLNNYGKIRVQNGLLFLTQYNNVFNQYEITVYDLALQQVKSSMLTGSDFIEMEIPIFSNYVYCASYSYLKRFRIETNGNLTLLDSMQSFSKFVAPTDMVHSNNGMYHYFSSSNSVYYNNQTFLHFINIPLGLASQYTTFSENSTELFHLIINSQIGKHYIYKSSISNGFITSLTELRFDISSIANMQFLQHEKNLFFAYNGFDNFASKIIVKKITRN